MVTYTYRARIDKTGEEASGSMQSNTERDVISRLRKDGMMPVEIVAKGSSISLFSRRRISTKDRILFARQLSTLINAGLPLVQSLRMVEEQTSNPAMHAIVGKVISDVEVGKSFSESLAAFPAVFSQVFVGLVQAGEASGTLDKSLERLAFQQEKDAEIVSKVRGAFIYPSIVLVVMLGVVTFMIIVVLPQVEELYKNLGGASLPLITQIMVSISNFIVGFWWVVLIALVGGGLGFYQWLKTNRGHLVSDTIRMKVPPFNGIFQKLYMARFARTAYTLVSSAVPIIQVLEITGGAISNVLLANSLHQAAEKVKTGRALSAILGNDSNFLPLVPSMLKIGEQSGAMDQMLERVADYYEKEVDTAIKNISTVIEPALMIILGLMAIVIVAAVLLPVYSLVNKSFV